MKSINFWDTDVGIKDYLSQKKVFLSNYPNEGKYVFKLENEVKKILKVKYCIALTSCTSALYVALKVLKIGNSDEVLVPNITFSATANAVFMSGAKIKLVDINPKTLNLDINDLKKKISNKTKAIIPVHVSGRACDMKSIKKIAKKKRIKIIEDAAEAFLSKYKKKFLGTVGDVGCFSLSPNKIFTSGQGGILVTNNKKIYEKVKVFKTQGRVGITNGGDDLHISAGGNFKISNICGALGLSQLKQVFLRKKIMIKNYLCYKNNLKNIEEIKVFPFDIKNGELPLWTDVYCKDRDKLFDYLKKRKIICRKFWFPLSKKNFYSKQNHKNFENTLKVEKNIMWLPSSFLMSNKDQLKVIKNIKNFYDQSK